MKKILIISALGVLGVLSRHLLETRLGNKGELLPIGTLLANIIGCFIAGFFYQLTVSKSQHQELASMVLVGLCGGLTTFSGYALASFNDISDGNFTKAGLYLALSPVLGLISAFFGMKIFKIIF